MFRQGFLYTQADDGPGFILDVKVVQRSVLGCRHLVPSGRGDMNKGPGRDNPAIGADKRVDFSHRGKDEQFVGMVMNHRSLAGFLAIQAEVNRFPFYDRAVRG
ncbi:MAG: hypothetical protein ACD_87C00262G0001 [uncultured bacterium]|nr:MAG: hypothetical protein ACD_87C00262G0001 [uncultured bacterium]